MIGKQHTSKQVHYIQDVHFRWYAFAISRTVRDIEMVELANTFYFKSLIKWTKQTFSQRFSKYGIYFFILNGIKYYKIMKLSTGEAYNENVELKYVKCNKYLIFSNFTRLFLMIFTIKYVYLFWIKCVRNERRVQN